MMYIPSSCFVEHTAEVDAPDEPTWRWFEAAAGRLPVLDAQLEASTVRVSFAWDGAERTVTPQPEAEVLGGEYVVTEPTELRIEGVGTVRIRGAVPDVEVLRSERSRLAGEVKAVLDRHRAADAAALAAAVQRAAELDGRRKGLEGRLEEEAGEGPGDRERLAAMDRQMEHLRRAVAELPEDSLTLSLDRLRSEVTDADRERSRLEGAIEAATAEADAAEAKRLELIAVRQEAETTRTTHNAQIGMLQEVIARTLEPDGTAEHLERLRATAQAKREELRAAVEAMRGEYEQKVETPHRLEQLARDRVRELQESVRGLDGEIKETLAKVEEAAAHGNYAKRADVEIELEWKGRRREVLQRRVDGAKQLRELVRAREGSRSAALAGPVQELVDRWLRLLSDDGYDGLRIDHDLKPTGVRVRRYGLDLPLSSLSHGAKEQIVVLLRLAIACLVSGDERNLVVIDDRLVNADAVRMKRLCLILAEVAKSCRS